MRQPFIFAFLSLIMIKSWAQEIDRSYLTIMVIPYSSSSNNDSVLKMFKEEVNYRAAIGELNNALISRGYMNTQDLRTQMELIDRIRNATKDGVERDPIKLLIEEAPADIVIEAELIWNKPEGRPQDSQAEVILNAIDKHTASLYASNSRIKSHSREFNSLREAVEAALNRDAKGEFDSFLSQMETSLMRGRQLRFRFELSSESPIDFLTEIRNHTINTHIKQALRKHALKGFSKITGQSETFIEGFTIEPIIDQSGFYVLPCETLCTGLQQDIRKLGVLLKYRRVGQQVLFELEGLMK